MLTNLAFVFICVRASSALIRTSAFLQPVVRVQVYICEISPPLSTSHYAMIATCILISGATSSFEIRRWFEIILLQSAMCTVA